MPVFSLDEALVFPHPLLREPEGLMAVGGDLSTHRLLLAYRWGIFPWYHHDQPIMWWWIAPRLMLNPKKIHISRSLRKLLRQKKFEVTFNKDFRAVIKHCQVIERKDQEGTWIVSDMIDAYVRLHELGYAQSVEVYEEGQLVGGIYGISLGKIFYGESMFSRTSNASKVALIFLAEKLAESGFMWIDCQQDTPHMRSMGGELVEEEEFMDILRMNHRYISF